MTKPLSLFIASRYLRAKSKNRFISFISLSSMLGVALGVIALITVLSVMNGFAKEIKERVLSMIPHGTIYASYQPLVDWQGLSSNLFSYPEVVATAPFAQGQGMLTNSGIVRGVQVIGILPKLESNISTIVDQSDEANFNSLTSAQFNTVIGAKLANHLGVRVGDKITLVIPDASVTPAGVMPRFKRLIVSGIFNTGSQYDGLNIYVHLKDAAKLFRLGDAVTGVHVRYSNLYSAPRMSNQFNQDLTGFIATDWTREHGNYFDAIKLEKTMMFLILLLVVAVAAFNIVSTLVMIVTDKQSEIAILRTMGASRGLIMRTFMMQGSISGIIGTSIGTVLGIIVALNISDWFSFIQETFEVQLISADVYFISFLPSELQARDVILTCSVSLVLTIVAAIYPAWRAANIQPAEALRYE